MKKRNRVAAVMLVACMGASLVAGCGNKSDVPPQSSGTEEVQKAGGIDTSEHVVLTMYCIGDEGGIYANQHIEEVNKILTEKINAEIEPVMVSWGDYKTKLPMVWAGGETYDLTYTSNWTGYFVEGEKGAFMDITDLFPEYAPKTYADFEAKGYLDSCMIGDKLYMVPADKPDYTSFIMNYREDLRKKYNCPEIVDKETLNKYLQAIKDNEQSVTPFYNNATEAVKYQLFLNENNWSRPVDSSMGIYVYDLDDPTKIFDVTQTDEYKAFVEENQDYFDKGYWSQSIMAETSAPKDMFEGGQSGLYLGNISNSNTVYMNIKAQHPDWEIGYFSSDLLDGEVEQISPANNGMAVGAYSKNPERALMFIELMYTDEEVYDVVMNGLEGITYEADREARTKWVPEGTDPGDIALRNLGMGFGTTKYELGSLNDSPLVLEMKEQFTEKAVFPELSGYSVKQDNISAEMAAIKSVVDEYKLPLDKGAAGDTDKALDNLHKKIKDAGGDKLLEEINAQIKDYLAK